MCGDLRVQRLGECLHETKRYVNYHVSALDSLVYVSLDGRHRTRVRAGRVQAHWWDTHRRRLAVRNAGARRTAIGIHHHPPLVAPCFARSAYPHEGRWTCRRQDRQLERKVLLGLDALHARRDGPLLRHPLGARTVEPAMAPALGSGTMATLVIHICGGVVGLLSGIAAMSFRKGSEWHRRAGNIFFISMLTMASTAALLGNVGGGVFTAYLVTTGWRTARRREGETTIFDWVRFWLLWRSE